MEEEDRELDWDALAATIRQLAILEQNAALLGRRKKELRDRLEAITLLEGVPDEKDHLWLQFPDGPISGYTALKIERRVSTPLDAEKAEEILRSIVVDMDGPVTLWDECIEFVPQLNEDAVMAAHYEGRITAEQIDEMYPKHVTDAFVPQKPRSR